jgi:hypothetical protein
MVVAAIIKQMDAINPTRIRSERPRVGSTSSKPNLFIIDLLMISYFSINVVQDQQTVNLGTGSDCKSWDGTVNLLDRTHLKAATTIPKIYPDRQGKFIQYVEGLFS